MRKRILNQTIVRTQTICKKEGQTFNRTLRDCFKKSEKESETLKELT